jgi:hypothetical protein
LYYFKLEIGFAVIVTDIHDLSRYCDGNITPCHILSDLTGFTFANSSSKKPTLNLYKT